MINLLRLLEAACIAVFLSAPAYADTISPAQAIDYAGQDVVVEGVVSQVSVSGKGTTFLNFGGLYPDEIFYAVIFANNSDLFPGVENLEGRNVTVTGVIEIYRGKPEIILASPDQLQLR